MKTASPPEPKALAIPDSPATKVRRNNPQAKLKATRARELEDAIKKSK
jgi:hypothetical protein